MNTFSKLIRLSAKPKRSPPKLFLSHFELENEIGEFQRAAWKLFCRERRAIEYGEVKAYLASIRLPKIADRVYGACESHFLDSGSFSLQRRAKQWAEKKNRSEWKFYDTKEFWKYMERYAQFVKENSDAIDLYANVDVIGNSELSMRNQEWLEAQGLEPIPVVHFNSPDTAHLLMQAYRNEKMIALGGLVAVANDHRGKVWLDKAFSYICDTKDRLPAQKVHGFGMTSYEWMIRYPWWSVDSSSWSKSAGFGNIYVPHFREGRFVFDTQPYTVCCTTGKDGALNGRHILTMTKMEQALVYRWLDKIGIPLGENDKYGDVIRWGVVNGFLERRVANLLFFERMRNSMPEYPWPFEAPTRLRKRKGLIQ